MEILKNRKKQKLGKVHCTKTPCLYWFSLVEAVRLFV